MNEIMNRHLINAGIDNEPLARELSMAIQEETVTIHRSRNRPSSQYMEYITFDSISGRGKTVKTGNIRLNWKNVFTSLRAYMAVTAATTPTPDYLKAAFAVMCGVYEFLKMRETEISEKLAYTMAMAWYYKDETHHMIEEPVLLQKVNDVFPEQGMNPMNMGEMQTVLRSLEKLKCIRHYKDQLWKVEEEVRLESFEMDESKKSVNS